MGPVADATSSVPLDNVPTSPTNRFYPLPDGRDLTWCHWPVENASGQVIVDQHTDGHLDGRPISDEELHEILRAHGLR
jgi:hypothetical protein